MIVNGTCLYYGLKNSKNLSMPNTPRATDGNENTSVFSAAQPTSQSLTRVSECYEIIETIGFHGLIPYIEALDSVSKIELYNDIRAIRS